MLVRTVKKCILKFVKESDVKNNMNPMSIAVVLPLQFEPRYHRDYCLQKSKDKAIYLLLKNNKVSGCYIPDTLCLLPLGWFCAKCKPHNHPL